MSTSPPPEERDEPLVLLPRELSGVRPPRGLIGQKAEYLIEATQLKARVPRFGVLTRAAFDLHVGQREIAWLVEDATRSEQENPAETTAWCARLERAVSTLALPEEVEWALDELVSAFSDDELLAVRPSVVVTEDDPSSVAGLYETFLFVRGLEPVREAVRGVFASAFSTAAVARRRELGLPPFDSRLGVVVQRMVDAEVSGRCRSLERDSVVGRAPRAELLATFGNAGGMSRSSGTGRLSYDLAWIARPSLADHGVADDALVEMEQNPKSTALRFDSERGQGTRLVPVDEETREHASLADDKARLVAREAVRLESLLSRPVEIEFALAGHLVHVLGLRPVFTPRARIESTRTRIFDERLIPEGARGVVTATSASVLMSTFVPAFTRALELLGGAPDALDEQRSVRGRLIGFIDGRPYVQTSALRAFLDLLPDGRLLAEGLARTTNAVSLVEGSPPVPSPDDDAPTIARFLKTADRALDEGERALPGHEKDLRALAATFSDALDPDQAVDLLDRVLALLRAAEGHHLAQWLASHAGFGTLERLIDAWIPRAREGLALDLLCPENEAESQPPASVRAIEQLARSVVGDPILRRMFEDEGDALALADRIEGASFAGPFFAGLNDVLHALGPRFIAGRKLETPSLSERTDVVLDLVRRRVSDLRDLSGRGSLARGFRRKAEVTLNDDIVDKRMLKGLSSRRKIVDRTLDIVRRATHLFDRYAAFNLEVIATLRSVMRALGDRFFEHRVLAQPIDIFALSVDEIRGLVRGSAFDTDPRLLIQARKRAYVDARAVLPAEIEAQGMMAALTLPKGESPTTKQVSFEFIPAASGEATGKARVLELPSAARGLDVLTSFSAPAAGGVVFVTRADLALVPVLMLADAVVIGRGSPLSSLAGALRRAGIPCVVGADLAFGAVSEGELVHVDGRSGIVTFVERASDVGYEPAEGDIDSFARLAAPTDPSLTALPRAQLSSSEGSRRAKRKK
jgi:phosphohistidine swiveling domain-containing protein